jgi:hypothetical protein
MKIDNWDMYYKPYNELRISWYVLQALYDVKWYIIVCKHGHNDYVVQKPDYRSKAWTQNLRVFGLKPHRHSCVRLVGLKSHRH